MYSQSPYPNVQATNNFNQNPQKMQMGMMSMGQNLFENTLIL